MNTDATTVRPDSQVQPLIKHLPGLVAVFHEPPRQKVNLTPFLARIRKRYGLKAAQVPMGESVTLSSTVPFSAISSRLPK